MSYIFVVLSHFIGFCRLALFLVLSNQCVLFADNFAFEKLLKSRPPITDKIDTIDSKNTGMDFGHVDYKILLLFHPDMRVYNFKVNNFYRPVPQDLKVPLKFYLEDRERKSVELIKSAQRNYDKHDRKLLALHRDKNRVAADFAEQKRLLLLDKFANKQTELIKLNELKKNALEEVSIQIEATRKRMKKLYDQSFGIHYLSLTERQKAFRKIESEIKAVIEIVRKKQNLVFVLNNQVGELSESVKLNSRMFKYPGFVEMNNLWKYLHRSKQLPSGEIDTIRLGDDINSMLGYYNRQSSVGSIFRLPSINQFVLAGGRNITLLCLEEIYSKYRYPRNKIVRLINILAELDKGGTE